MGACPEASEVELERKLYYTRIVDLPDADHTGRGVRTTENRRVRQVIGVGSELQFGLLVELERLEQRQVHGGGNFGADAGQHSAQRAQRVQRCLDESHRLVGVDAVLPLARGA